MPAAVRRGVGRSFLGALTLVRRSWVKAYSVGIAGAFHEFGPRSVIEPPLRTNGTDRISIGSGVFIGAGSWLQAIGETPPPGPALTIGDGTGMAGGCVISAALLVEVGAHVLFARNVYVADHNHAFEDIETPIMAQGITDPSPVRIGDGAWIGENAVVLGGVTIGRGAVIGANSVVLGDVPEYSVAVGAPARVVRTFGMC